jgi:hypothetical protein
MFVKVIYQDGKTGAVETYQLDELIAQKKIKKFMRSRGWCTIGVHPTRKTMRMEYQKPEGRKRQRKNESTKRR